MGAFADLRNEVAAVLGNACTGHPNWNVYPLPVDSPTPPAYQLVWADPWSDGRATFCQYQAHLDVRCISSRLEPDTGIETLELMVEAAVVALDIAKHRVKSIAMPLPYLVNNVPFQSTLLLIDATVQLVTDVGRAKLLASSNGGT